MLQLIQAIGDEQLLHLLKEDITYFTVTGNDITNELTPADREELSALADEPDTLVTLSEAEFQKATVK